MQELNSKTKNTTFLLNCFLNSYAIGIQNVLSESVQLCETQLTSGHNLLKRLVMDSMDNWII